MIAASEELLALMRKQLASCEEFRWNGQMDEEEEEVEEEVIDYATLTHPRKQHEKRIVWTLSPASYDIASSSPGLCGTDPIPTPDADWIAAERRKARAVAASTGKANARRVGRPAEVAARRGSAGGENSGGSEVDVSARTDDGAMPSAAAREAEAQRGRQRGHDAEVDDALGRRIEAMAAAAVKATSWGEVADHDALLREQQQSMQRQQRAIAQRLRAEMQTGERSASYDGTGAAAASGAAAEAPSLPGSDEHVLRRRAATAAVLSRSGHQHLLPDLPGYRAEDSGGAKHLLELQRRHHMEEHKALRLRIHDMAATCRERSERLAQEQAEFEQRRSAAASSGAGGDAAKAASDASAASVQQQIAQLDQRRAQLAALRKESDNVGKDAAASTAVSHVFSMVARSVGEFR